MPSLPQSVLHAKLRAALPQGTTFSSGEDLHPAVADIPGVGPSRIYLWTVTHIESTDRPPDEFKIQLILPGQSRQERGQLDLSGPHTAFLLGYSPDFGVFVAWEARLHERFSFSATVYVKESLLEDARGTGWSVAPPHRVQAGKEVRVAFTSGNLLRYLSLAKDADRYSRFGIAREGFFLTRTPNLPASEVPNALNDINPFINSTRRTLLVQRAERDSRFGPMVKQQYGYACALCGTQLDIVEGAHIIPVSVENSSDELWNGIALCPNHHKLFDASVFVVRANLQIQIDDAAVAFFEESNRSGGLIEMLTCFSSEKLKSPLFFGSDSELRRKMLKALRWRERLAAIGS